jgi:hypothetical protein
MPNLVASIGLFSRDFGPPSERRGRKLDSFQLGQKLTVTGLETPPACRVLIPELAWGMNTGVDPASTPVVVRELADPAVAWLAKGKHTTTRVDVAAQGVGRALFVSGVVS